MKVALFVSVAISCIAILFLLVDAWNAIWTWQSRIHIGRWTSRTGWQQALERKCREWLWHTPTVSIKDESRLVLWDMLRGRYKSSTIQTWQKAALLLALDEQDAKAYSSRYSVFGNNKEVLPEHALLAYALKQHDALRNEDEVMLAEYFETFENEGVTVPYRKSVQDVRFVDTIGFVCPYLYCVGKVTQADRQIAEFDKVLFDGIIPPHAFDVSTGCPMGIYDWSRGIGWYVLGLIASDGNRERIMKLANYMLAFQRKDGGYNSQVFDKGSCFESSGTVLMGLLMLKAYELSKDERYIQSAKRVEHCLMAHTRRDGTLDFAQGDTKGIGHYSSVYDRMPFAQGLALFLSKHLNKYDNVKNI